MWVALFLFITLPPQPRWKFGIPLKPPKPLHLLTPCRRAIETFIYELKNTWELFALAYIEGV